MNATVEITHTNILRRLALINSSIQNIKRGETRDIINILQSEYNVLQTDYDEQSGVILLKYYKNHDNSHLFFSFINSENIATRLDQCMHYIGECYEILQNPKTAFEHIKKKYNRSPVFEQPTLTVDYELCECGDKMNTTINSNEIVCYSCGWIKVVHIDSTEDTVYGRRDDKSVKHGKYDPSRRCKFWIDRIQGRENAEISDECIKAVSSCIARDNITKSVILCMQIREYLKETGFTVYNDHVTLIRKQITGYAPPNLTETELQLLYHIFNKVITIFDDIKPSKKYNSPYYPYIVGKILYELLPRGMRRRKILECIHMQSNTTLISNDLLMKIICDKVPEIKYTPTIKSEFTIIR
jgi:hypothetical protein